DTVDYHYGKHLDTYIKNLNGLIAGTKYEKLPLEKIVTESATDADAKKIFNNAAQTFNHHFFFFGLKRDGATAMPKQIADAFGGADKFNAAFKEAALGVFGSGWVWLTADMKIITTPNADTPIAHGQKPILTLDVWEHAYYLDHQNRRGDFIDAFLNHLIDWEWVAGNLDSSAP
ncbi:MAG: superoxide dismutase, partial [Proteobacteria bacterium]|nr:superoxide dismutase [Pseudomonadota bacterium]